SERVLQFWCRPIARGFQECDISDCEAREPNDKQISKTASFDIRGKATLLVSCSDGYHRVSKKRSKVSPGAPLGLELEMGVTVSSQAAHYLWPSEITLSPECFMISPNIGESEAP